MTFLPIVERELRVASRRRNTYWTRFFAAMIALGVCTWIWVAVGDSPRSELPKTLFNTLSALAFGYSLIIGMMVTADCLSEEKREGTLGLLFLTDLKGYDVVLGKLVASSVNSLYRLLAIFPVLAIPLLFGGLTPGEFWRTVLVLGNTLFFSLSAGMFFSAISRQERGAMAGTFSLVIAIAALPPLIGYLLSVRQNTPLINPILLQASPGYAYYMAFDGPFKTNPLHYWSSILFTHLLGWLLLVLTGVIARNSWQDKPAGQRGVLWRERWQRWKFGEKTVRDAFRARLLGINPFLWMAGRNRLKPAFVYAFLGLAGAFWLWLFFRYSRDVLDAVPYISTALILHTVIKFWLASEACRPLAEDRRTGALELVLSTPLKVDEILRGQILALKRQFAGPVIVVLIADFVMFLAGMHDRFVDTSNDWPLLCLSGVVIFVADLYTMAWVGMWLGLTSRKTNWAAFGTVFRILWLPWIIFCGLLTVTIFMPNTRGLFNESGSLIGAWFVIGMLNNLYFLMWSRTNLRQAFRTVVTQRFDAKSRAGWWLVKEEKALIPNETVKA
jgi:ABC-type transport system involved in multi-copper enzyme maturation permease subunit